MVRVIRLTLQAESAVLVAGEKEGPYVRQLSITLPSGKTCYIIPSTSWKGALRGAASKIAPTMDFGDRLANLASRLHAKGHAASSSELEDAMEALIGDEEVGRAFKNFYPDEEFDADKPEHVALALAVKCPVERLFGSQYSAGRIIILDTLICESDTHICGSRLLTIPHVGIDRKTARAKEDRLFFEQAIPPGTIMTLTIIDHTRPGSPERALLEALLSFIEAGYLRIGSGKSRGMGRLALKNREEYDIQ